MTTDSCMSYTTPVAITDAMLVSTNVPETDYPAWAVGTTYALGALVIVTAAGVHNVYESLQAANVGHDPTLPASSTWWGKVSRTNRWKCFATPVGSVTSQASPISYRIKPGEIVNLAAFIRVQADEIRVRMIDPVEGTVYDSTTSLQGGVLRASPYEWFFRRRVRKEIAVFADLPPYPDADVLIDISGAGTVSVGLAMVGYQVRIGMGVALGARTGITDYSRKTPNAYGDVDFEELAYADKANWVVRVSASEEYEAKLLLTRARAKPSLWMGPQERLVLLTFGWVADFEVLIAYRTESEISVDLKGLA